ncbi:efflux RND transporter permease subunit [Psychrobium sp. MM17-31]|uniref:efflux RND transporter permease subunit n=1 Tax=Psychrobium sp. MM17-31 TaxID=2917758 RepID=UPI001EF5C990|nr:efflux RND transporter permease subunit [Psychrobium sp. MM17-31]MCG7531313.1 efflux RND transporter permease subunit [Psychrobium sp. MM17-31]
MINHYKSNVMDAFVKRPVLSIVLSLFICLAGLWAVKSIAVLQFPMIKSASLTINTVYTGASAEVVKGFVTDPIERVAATVPGVEYVDSSTTSGQSTVTAWLKLNEDTTAALAELNTRLSQIKFELPPGAEDPAVSVTRTDRPHAVFYLNVEAKGSSLSQLSDYLTRQVNPIISNIDGVQKVGIEGARTPAMRIWLDANRMNVLNVSSDEVYSALASNNSISTLGYGQDDTQRIDIVANTQLSSIEEFEQLIVKRDQDGIVYVKDIADVKLGAEQASNTARFNQQDTVYISVYPLPGANEIAIGDRLYQVLDNINANAPNGLHINIAYDGTLYMRDALKEIVSTLIETVVLVGIVVLLMMGSFKTALVPLITIPISILGAIAAIWVMGFTLNLLTVLAIVLSVGLVVDDAIVVVENVARHVRDGMPRIQAALVSSRQLLVPVISMTLTLAMVYAPIGFLSGLTGVLFKEFAFTLAIAVLLSGVVAITLSPIMSAYVSDTQGREGRLTKAVNGVFAKLQQRYSSLLTRAMGFQGQIMLVALVIGLLIVPFYLHSKKELAPIEDQSSINVVMQSPPESSLAYNESNIKPVVDNLLSVDGSKKMWQIVTSNGGFGGLEFVESSERDFTTNEKMPEIYGRLTGSAALNNLPILPSPLPTAGQFDVEMVVKSSASYDELKGYADQLVYAAFGSGLFLYADTDLKIDLPQMQLSFNRQKIADLGMTVQDVSRQLNVYLSANFVNRFDANGKAYRVIPMLDNAIANDPQQLKTLTIKIPSGELVSISDFVTVSYNTVPRALGSFGQQNAFKIYGGILPGVTKEQALAALEQAAADILPKSYAVDYAGESREIRKEGNSLMTIMGISLAIVFMILAIQFNSFRDPLVILFGCVPLAMSGALMLPFFEITTINIYSQIGLVTLVGLIAKNGILIVEFANHLQEQGQNKLQAVVESASTRLRPILMTTLATVLGHFPLVLVTGAGAEARNSIGVILVAGMLIGTVFTLFILPVFYVWFASDHRPKESANDSEELATQPTLKSA